MFTKHQNLNITAKTKSPNAHPQTRSCYSKSLFNVSIINLKMATEPHNVEQRIIFPWRVNENTSPAEWQSNQLLAKTILIWVWEEFIKCLVSKILSTLRQTIIWWNIKWGLTQSLLPCEFQYYSLTFHNIIKPRFLSHAGNILVTTLEYKQVFYQQIPQNSWTQKHSYTFQLLFTAICMEGWL